MIIQKTNILIFISFNLVIIIIVQIVIIFKQFCITFVNFDLIIIFFVAIFSTFHSFRFSIISFLGFTFDILLLLLLAGQFQICFLTGVLFELFNFFRRLLDVGMIENFTTEDAFLNFHQFQLHSWTEFDQSLK